MGVSGVGFLRCRGLSGVRIARGMPGGGSIPGGVTAPGVNSKVTSSELAKLSDTRSTSSSLVFWVVIEDGGGTAEREKIGFRYSIASSLIPGKIPPGMTTVCGGRRACS